MGGVSATGAFIINQTLGGNFTDAAQLDKAIGREPNKPGDSSKLSLELLKRGLSVESYAPSSPLDEPAQKLAHGEIDFDEYLKVYEACRGPIATDDYALFREFYEKTFVPAWLEREKRFATYKATGQMISRSNSEISRQMLETLVNNGKHIFTGQITRGETGAHAIAIFRPKLTMPALIFSPGTDKSNPHDASRILPLSELEFKSFENSAIGAIALWEQG